MNEGTRAASAALVMDDMIQASVSLAEAAPVSEAISVMDAPRHASSIDLEATLPHTPQPSPRKASARAERVTSCDGADDLIGKNLAQYHILEHLGRGSMANVYKAWHLGLERVSALKIIDPLMVARRPGMRDQFWAEARAAANLAHPNVVTIHNLGSDGGFHFIEMEYVPGSVSLRDSLVKEGPFEPTRAARLVRQVLKALGAAHEAGLVHRDVKPANVLLTPEGNAKLADFGLAQVRSKMARAGQPLAGTPTFMAPELFSGTPASPQSDLYAVGVMFYCLLTGRLPFRADRIDALIRLHLTQPVPDIRKIAPSVNQRLAEIIGRCLAKAPADRYATTRELADELQLLIHHFRDTESLVRQSLEGVDCFIQGSRDTFRIMIPQPGNRLHEVMVEVNDGEGGRGERFLTVFSVCGPADPAHFGAALALNSRLTCGGLSIRYVLGKPMLVMSRTFPRDRARPYDLRDTIREIAANSDRIEKKMTRLDLY